jgi:hypothetical protein
MAKTKQKTLGDVVPEVPAGVQDAADDYASCLRALGKSKEKKNDADGDLIAAMRQAGITQVEIDLGNKMIELSSADKLKIKKIKKPKDDNGEDTKD